MLMSPSAYFPLTEQQVKMSLKDPAAINHFRHEVQRPMLQEALKVVKDHGSEWLSFPKLFGIGAHPRHQSPFWYSVLKALEIPVMLPTRECQFFVQNLPNIVQSLNMDLPSTLDMLTTQLLLQEEWKSNMGWLFVKRYFRKTIIFNNYCIYKFHTQLNVLQFCSI